MKAFDLSLMNLAIGQQIIASFNDAPDSNCLVVSFDQRELKRNLLKKDVTIEVLMQTEKGNFIPVSIVQKQIVYVGEVIKLNAL